MEQGCTIAIFVDNVKVVLAYTKLLHFIFYLSAEWVSIYGTKWSIRGFMIITFLGNILKGITISEGIICDDTQKQFFKGRMTNIWVIYEGSIENKQKKIRTMVLGSA